MGKTAELKSLLRDADIDAITEKVGHFLAEQGLEPQEALRLRLTMERLLLRVRDRFDWGQECVLTLGSRFGQPYVLLSYAGESYDPTALHRESDGEAWSARLLESYGVVPVWSCRRGVNYLALYPRRKARSCFIDHGIAIVSAIALGLLSRMADAAWLEGAERLALTPLFNMFLGAAGTFAGLMVFFSAACGVCGVGDTVAFDRVGRASIRRFAALSAAWLTAACAAGMILFKPDIAAARDGLRLWYGVAPSDPISLFRDGAVGQIILFGAIAGIALLTLGARADRLRVWMEQSSALTRAITAFLCRLSPVFVFVTLLRQIARHSLASFLPLWKPLAVVVAIGTAITAIKLLATCVSLREHPRTLVKKLLPTFLLAFFTASSAAAFGKTMDNCETRLGIGHRLVLLGLPIGNVLCVPFCGMALLEIVLYLAKCYGIAVSVPWLLAAALLSAILAAAMPQVSGAFPVCFGLLLTPLGIPTEGVAAMAVLSVFLDAFCTACGNMYLQLELMTQAKKQQKEKPA